MAEKDLAQAIREFVESLLLFLKQQGRQLVEQALTAPLQQAGQRLLKFVVLWVLMSLAAAFLGIGLVMLLAAALNGNYGLAFLVMGMILVLVCGLLYRSGQPAAAGEEAGNDAGEDPS